MNNNMQPNAFALLPINLSLSLLLPPTEYQPIKFWNSAPKAIFYFKLHPFDKGICILCIFHGKICVILRLIHLCIPLCTFCKVLNYLPFDLYFSTRFIKILPKLSSILKVSFQKNSKEQLRIDASLMPFRTPLKLKRWKKHFVW